MILNNCDDKFDKNNIEETYKPVVIKRQDLLNIEKNNKKERQNKGENCFDIYGKYEFIRLGCVILGFANKTSTPNYFTARCYFENLVEQILIDN